MLGGICVVSDGATSACGWASGVAIHGARLNRLSGTGVTTISPSGFSSVRAILAPVSLTKPFLCVVFSACGADVVSYTARLGPSRACILSGSTAFSSILYRESSESAVEALCDMPLVKNATSPSSGGLCVDDLREDSVENESRKEFTSSGRSCRACSSGGAWEELGPRVADTRLGVANVKPCQCVSIPGAWRLGKTYILCSLLCELSQGRVETILGADSLARIKPGRCALAWLSHDGSPDKSSR